MDLTSFRNKSVCRLVTAPMTERGLLVHLVRSSAAPAVRIVGVLARAAGFGVTHALHNQLRRA
jgi:hypothetical protein